MSEYLIQDTTLEDIADAIRAKKGTQAGIQVSDFPSEILSIPTGSSGAILSPTSNLMASTTGTLTEEIVWGHYFKCGNDYYSIGIQLTGSDNTYGYVALFKRVNGVWVKQGNMTPFSNVHYQIVLNTMQYVLYTAVQNIIMFTFYEGSSSYIYLYDIDNLTLTHSYTTPGYNVVLYNYPANPRYIGMYCATTDRLYYRYVEDDGSLNGTDWRNDAYTVFGSTDPVPSMVWCRTNYVIFLKRPDVPKLVRYDLGNGPGRTHYHYNYTMGDYTQWSAMFYLTNTGLFFFKADGLTSSTYGGIRPYGVYYKATLTNGSPGTCDLYSSDSYGTTFIPLNNNIFFDGDKQCMNGLGCAGYTDANNYNSRIILI